MQRAHEEGRAYLESKYMIKKANVEKVKNLFRKVAYDSEWNGRLNISPLEAIKGITEQANGNPSNTTTKFKNIPVVEGDMRSDDLHDVFRRLNEDKDDYSTKKEKIKAIIKKYKLSDASDSQELIKKVISEKHDKKSLSQRLIDFKGRKFKDLVNDPAILTYLAAHNIAGANPYLLPTGKSFNGALNYFSKKNPGKSYSDAVVPKGTIAYSPDLKYVSGTIPYRFKDGTIIHYTGHPDSVKKMNEGDIFEFARYLRGMK